MKASYQGALTNWRAQRKGQMSTCKGSKLLRGTYFLESTEAGTNLLTERKQVIQGHSPTGECRGRDKSAYRKEASYPGALTN